MQRKRLAALAILTFFAALLATSHTPGQIRAGQGDVEIDATAEAGRGGDIPRQGRCLLRHQQDVIVGEAFAYELHQALSPGGKAQGL